MSCCNPLIDWMFPAPVAISEMWKRLIGIEWPYEVSDKGQVRTLNYNRTGKTKILKTQVNKGGYTVVPLQWNKKGAIKTVHSLVMRTFVGDRPESAPDVNHINGIKSDNRLTNLEYVTKSRNTRHSFELGLQCNKGVQHSQAKLDDEKVREIRDRLFLGQSFKKIAGDFGVTAAAIANIKYRRNWTHVL